MFNSFVPAVARNAVRTQMLFLGTTATLTAQLRGRYSEVEYTLPKGDGERGGDVPGPISLNLGNMGGLTTLPQPHAEVAFGTGASRGLFANTPPHTRQMGRGDSMSMGIPIIGGRDWWSTVANN